MCAKCHIFIKKNWKTCPRCGQSFTHKNKVHLVFHLNTITQCRLPTRDFNGHQGVRYAIEREDKDVKVTCMKCLRWMKSKEGRRLGYWPRKVK